MPSLTDMEGRVVQSHVSIVCYHKASHKCDDSHDTRNLWVKSNCSLHYTRSVRHTTLTTLSSIVLVLSSDSLDYLILSSLCMSSFNNFTSPSSSFIVLKLPFDFPFLLEIGKFLYSYLIFIFPIVLVIFMFHLYTWHISYTMITFLLS